MTSAAKRLSGISIATALCLTLAAAPAIGAPMYLKIKGVDGESTDDKHKNEIEILSWSWGATQTSHGTGGMGAGKVSKVESLTIKQTSATAQGEKGGTEDINIGVGELQEASAPAPGEAEITLKGDTAEEARKRPGRVKYGDITLKQGTAEAASGGVSVAAGDLDGDGRAVTLIPQHEVVSPRDSASGLPTGKRQHNPMTITKEWDATTPLLRAGAPPPQGSLRVKVKMPWLACRVGARYPELEFGDAATAYKFKEVLVTSCGSSSGGDRPMEQISFNYAKIEF